MASSRIDTAIAVTIASGDAKLVLWMASRAVQDSLTFRTQETMSFVKAMRLSSDEPV